MAGEFDKEFSINIQKLTDMKRQKLLDDHSNPYGQTINKDKQYEREIYERRNKTNDTACFTEDYKNCLSLPTIYQYNIESEANTKIDPNDIRKKFIKFEKKYFDYKVVKEMKNMSVTKCQTECL